jgi:DNA-binding MarR family transcriptional regulator
MQEEQTTLQYKAAIPDERYGLRILQSLRRIVRSIDIHSRKLSMQHDITAPQLITLLAICGHGPMTIADISKEVHLSPSTLVGIIDRLEAKKLVIRERATVDRRKVMINATEQGKSFASEAPSPLQETLAQALADLNDLEQSTIALSLERIVELMEAKELDAAPILSTGAIDTKNS